MTPDEYHCVHSARVNLAIHIVAVPAFIVATLGAAGALATGHLLAAALLALGPPLAMAAQGYGHAQEAVAARPFTGPWNAARRIVVEQFVTFPRYVATGGWLSAWRAAGRNAPQDAP